MEEFYKQLPFKGLFIDFDGTLADTMPILYGIYLQFLKEQGHQGDEEEFTTLVGQTLIQIAATLKKKYNLKPSVEDLFNSYEQLLQKEYLDKVQFFPNSIETLQYAKKELGYPLALVTSAPKKLINKILEKHKLSKLFDLIVGAEDIEKGKPDPEIYLKALKMMNLQPNAGLAFEDSFNGVAAALDAGMTCVLISNGDDELKYRCRNQWETPDTLGFMEDWAEVENFFKTLPLLSESDFYDE